MPASSWHLFFTGANCNVKNEPQNRKKVICRASLFFSRVVPRIVLFNALCPISFSASRRVLWRVLRYVLRRMLRPIALAVLRPIVLAVSVFALTTPIAHAWVLNVTPGPRTIGLIVGNNAAGAAPNIVSVTVPAAVLGTGALQAMTSDSTQAASPFDNFTVCVPPNQVYVGGYLRELVTGGNSATLSVTTPATLSNGTETISFTQISWTSTSIGNGGAADIPAGTFNGGNLVLRNIASNRWVENCHIFSYANTNFVAAGIYTGRATYTLVAP